jgi:PTS system N-acetylgalactosamine-specific IIA component
MKYLVLVSHGGFAAGLKSSLAMFAGDKMDQVIATGLENGKSAAEFREVFKEAISPIQAEDEMVLLADIIGGSPLTTALILVLSIVLPLIFKLVNEPFTLLRL